ncbi:MAG: acyl-CoA dehydrogenase family protein [Dehalococcoidales bacterium]|nr:acyl-CoA dehydrogenase family protein [Dehalococcoidales bacterium]
MDFTFTPEEEAFRKEVAAFLEKEVPQVYREKRLTFFDMSAQPDWIKVHRVMAEKLGAKGWISKHWPREYGGQDVSPFHRLILREELIRYHSPGYDAIGAGIVAPALMLKGSEEQKKQHLPGIASGKEIWCETLSEPGHGSDLASIEVFAKEESDCFVVNGQKIWTTNGHFADWNALIVRTDREADPNYRGLTFFLLDMKTPGITVNPVINMAGHHDFNEVFFDDVRIPKENIVGGLNKGFYVVMSLLDYERTTDPVYAMAGTYLSDLAEYARENRLLDPLMKNRVAQLRADYEIARLHHYRVTWMQSRDMVPNTESAMNKMVSFELLQRVSEFGMELTGQYSQLTEDSARVPMYGRIPSCYLRSFGHSLEQGTSEIDRDVIAQRGLGLPRLR